MGADLTTGAGTSAGKNGLFFSHAEASLTDTYRLQRIHGTHSPTWGRKTHD